MPNSNDNNQNRGGLRQPRRPISSFAVAGCVTGLISIVIGSLLVIPDVHRATVGLAFIALAVPLLTFAAWWVIDSMGNQDGEEEVDVAPFSVLPEFATYSAEPMAEKSNFRVARSAVVADVFDGKIHASDVAEMVDDVTRDEYRASVRRPETGTGI